MNGACEALKEPLEAVIRKFAYVDVELRATTRGFSRKWSLCTRVKCGDKKELALLVMASPEFAENVSNNFLGTEDSRPGQRIDIISELSNVLAGQAHEILCAGRPPGKFGFPELLGIREATEIWEEAVTEFRFALCCDTENFGGILIRVLDPWSLT